MKLVRTYGNFISKYPGIIEINAPIVAHMVLLIEVIQKTFVLFVMKHPVYIVYNKQPSVKPCSTQYNFHCTWA